MPTFLNTILPNLSKTKTMEADGPKPRTDQFSIVFI